MNASRSGDAAGSGEGALNRIVRVTVAAGRARAAVEDDFHHFRLNLRHAAGCVVAIEPESLRFPYSLCPAAGERLHELVGAPLLPRASDIFRLTEPRLQCTHQFDLAALAIARAAQGAGVTYRIEIPDPVEGRTRARLWRDGRAVLTWDVEGYAISGPEPYAGRGLGAGFTDWVASRFDEAEAEAALVLRRGVFVSRGRRMLEQLDAQRHAPSYGGCWAHQPERAQQALRMVRSWRDFSGDADELGAGDEPWLGFRGES